jgi:hypothetical protein
VIALDCLLIETLVGFITGQPRKGPDSFLTGKLTNGELQFNLRRRKHNFFARMCVYDSYGAEVAKDDSPRTEVFG